MPGSFQNSCNSISTDPALAFVDSGWDFFQDIATEASTLAFSQVTQLNNFNVDYINWNAQFEPDGVLGGYIRPARPDIQAIIVPDLTVTMPTVPTINNTPIVLEPAPTEPADLLNPPVLVMPAQPDEFAVPSPGDAPTFAILDAPIAPTIQELLPPSLFALVLPDAPDIVVPEFVDAVPLFDAAPPDETLNFTEQLYQSSFVDEIKAKLQNWIATDGRVPAGLSDALWYKASAREDASSLKLVQESRDSFGSRGFDEPTGVLRATQLEITQANRNARAGVTRDVYIQEETLAIENLKFAVQSGLQLEIQYMQNWLVIEGRRFELIVKAKDVAIAVFNARVQQYNVAIAGYNAKIEAYKALLTTLETRVRLYTAEIEGVKAISEVNDQQVRAYVAQIQAQAATADMYRSQIEGFKARIESERAQIEGYRASVDAYTSRVGAYSEEWKAYATRISAEDQKVGLYRGMISAYGERCNVWKTKGEVAIAQKQGDIQVIEAQLKQYDSQVRGVLAKLEAARISVDAQATRNTSLSDVYRTDASVEDTAVSADTRIFQAQTERERAKLDIIMKDAELQINQIIQRASLLLRAYETAGSASAQLAASSFSAVNFSAGISSSNGKSSNCSTSFSFSGEIIDS